MNKNNNETMNKRTHNPFNRYKENKNTNANNQTPEEFGKAFPTSDKKPSEHHKKNDR